jgi:hypothetical protein
MMQDILRAESRQICHSPSNSTKVISLTTKLAPGGRTGRLHESYFGLLQEAQAYSGQARLDDIVPAAETLGGEQLGRELSATINALVAGE